MFCMPSLLLLQTGSEQSESEEDIKVFQGQQLPLQQT